MMDIRVNCVQLFSITEFIRLMLVTLTGTVVRWCNGFVTGESGDTFRYLQLQSETKIRVTRDNGAELLVDQRSSGGGITCFAQSFFV